MKKGLKITNKNGIPRIIYLATLAEWYSGAKIDKDYSVTELLKPALLKRLEDEYFDQITMEASDQLWAVMGSAMHYILEQGAKQDSERYLLEKRFTEKFFEKKISGQIDVYDKKDKEIQDHKYTSVWNYVYKDAPNNLTIQNWTFQLNVYRLLAEKNGLPVKKLSINLIFRDFNSKKSEIDKNYPSTQAINIPIEILDDNQVLAQMQYHITKHEKAKGIPIESVEICSKEERWQDKDKWAVMKKGRKSAVKLFYGYNQAKNYIQNKIKPKDVAKCFLEKREGKPKRCLKYCSVAEYCPFFQKGEKND